MTEIHQNLCGSLCYLNIYFFIVLRCQEVFPVSPSLSGVPFPSVSPSISSYKKKIVFGNTSAHPEYFNEISPCLRSFFQLLTISSVSFQGIFGAFNSEINKTFSRRRVPSRILALFCFSSSSFNILLPCILISSQVPLPFWFSVHKLDT